MPVDLSADNVLDHLKRGKTAPFYLFYGESDFLLEQVLTRIRDQFIPEGERDFNLHIFYGDEIKNNVGELLDMANSFPFMGQNRLIIVRRVDDIPVSGLESLIPYLENPNKTTCLIFVSRQPDFRKKFYKAVRSSGVAVNFAKLYDNQVVPWIMKTAREIGLDMNPQTAQYLHQVVGNRMRDLYSELEKIYISYGSTPVDLEGVKRLAVYSRNFTLFELMDRISSKRAAEAIAVAGQYIEVEGKDGVLGVMGMLIRQMRLLWLARSFLDQGGRVQDLASELKIHAYSAKNLAPHVRHWPMHQIEGAFDELYRADHLIKTGSDSLLVLENVILSLCG